MASRIEKTQNEHQRQRPLPSRICPRSSGALDCLSTSALRAAPNHSRRLMALHSEQSYRDHFLTIRPN